MGEWVGIKCKHIARPYIKGGSQLSSKGIELTHQQAHSKEFLGVVEGHLISLNIPELYIFIVKPNVEDFFLSVKGGCVPKLATIYI